MCEDLQELKEKKIWVFQAAGWPKRRSGEAVKELLASYTRLSDLGLNTTMSLPLTCETWITLCYSGRTDSPGQYKESVVTADWRVSALILSACDDHVRSWMQGIYAYKQPWEAEQLNHS